MLFRGKRMIKYNEKNLIKQILVNTDLKQKDLAQKIGVSTAQISKWNKGARIPLSRQEQLIERNLPRYYDRRPYEIEQFFNTQFSGTE